ncbi:MAG TPA: four helix bundle protein [Vicinamibacteria bacterium]
MNGFQAGELALEIGARLRPVVQAVRRHDADLADQIYRAAKSLVLNVAEGGRRGGKDRGYHFRIAAGSTAELAAGIRFAVDWGFCASPSELCVLIDRELAMLWKLDERASPSAPPRGR